MSRLAKKPIKLASGVQVVIAADLRRVDINGPKGALSWSYPQGVALREEKDGAAVNVWVEMDPGSSTDGSAPARALLGLVWSRVHNMAEGVSKGFSKQLEVQGVGYKVKQEGPKLVLMLGASHPIEFLIPTGVAVTIDPKQTLLTIAGFDKELVGQMASSLRLLQPPEPYKGKGIRYVGEIIARKAGKAAASTGAGKK